MGERGFVSNILWMIAGMMHTTANHPDMIPNCKYIMHTTKKELKTGPQVTRPHWD
jgi:hypothetical protein